jgi:hypothetical protein
MNRKLAIWVVAAIVLLAAAVCGADEVFPVAHNEPIAVRVLNGKGGKPLANAHVVLVGGYDLRDLGLKVWRQEALTDSAGAVRLTNALRNLPLVRVEVIKQRSCGAEGAGTPFSVDLIRRDGINASNRCGTATATDGAGVLTVFVKVKKAGSENESAKKFVPKCKSDLALIAPQATIDGAAKTPAPGPDLTDFEIEAALAGQN